MVQKRRTVKSSLSKRNKINFGRWIFRVLFLAFLGAIFYIIFFSGRLAITTISISGEREIEPDLIMGHISPLIEGKYLGIVDKNNILLVRSGRMKADLSEGFKKIENVAIKRKFPGTLLIDIQERQTPIIYLGGDRGFSIDENGIAYDEVGTEMSGFSGLSSIILRDNSASGMSLGETVFDKRYIAYLIGIKEGMKKESDIDIDNNYETPSIVSSDIRVNTAEGWKVYFNTDISLKKELEMLNVSLENKIDKTRRSDLEYIDLRSDNKVFYKFKGGNEDVSEDIQPSSDEPAKEEKKDTKKDKKK